jgi:aryl-alcohol dehydrogenase-like predicted oxidoreductase
MELRSLGTSEVKITPIIMGTWQAGKDMWVGIDDSETIKALRAAFEAGIITIDTAEYYGNGHSEQIVGEALADVRDQVVYATKVFSNHLRYDQVMEACHGSLKNLKTDYLDLYQIHWPAGSWGTELVPIEETMRALNDLKQQGKIRAIGVSNFSRAQLEEASGHPDHKFAKGDHRARNRLFQADNYQRVQQALDNLRPIAGRYGVSLAQLALAWLIAQPQTCAIAGARKAEQVSDNAKAVKIQLLPEDLEEIDRIGRTVADHLDDNPVMWEF